MLKYSEWKSLPDWAKDQIKNDRKVGIQKFYKVKEEKEFITFTYEIVQPKLLKGSPDSWILPNNFKFDFNNHFSSLLYYILISFKLFKFLQKRFGNKIFSFENIRINKIYPSNLELKISITFIKKNKTDDSLQLSDYIRLNIPEIYYLFDEINNCLIQDSKPFKEIEKHSKSEIEKVILSPINKVLDNSSIKNELSNPWEQIEIKIEPYLK